MKLSVQSLSRAMCTVIGFTALAWCSPTINGNATGDLIARADLVDRAGRMNWSLQNVVCSFTGADRTSFTEGQQQFCNILLSAYGGTTLYFLEWISEAVCEGNSACELTMKVAFGVGGGFLYTEYGTYCKDIFQEIWNDCNGHRGSDQLTILGDAPANAKKEKRGPKDYQALVTIAYGAKGYCQGDSSPSNVGARCIHNGVNLGSQ
ncbi:uncharacterized protein KY384_008034 [Bacidia gigantensis]|uniref:uncharacterized protein n=1 Tax=Bacidia gigantensis TaxID=2732470 RepID=UPI001D03DAE6|nr:uncharacterized protein KY384_008034 [Bacidia gigantensis]KAG8527290.1 hypothetical protein KY384_008034 [Bacidia gigantensis]